MASQIPAWVPALFLGLVFLGYRQSKPRTVRPGAVAGVAVAMLGLSLFGVISTFGAVPIVLTAWVLGYAAALSIGTVGAASKAFALEGSSVRVPGSWVPMALLMAIFGTKFWMGFLNGMHSPLLQDMGFTVAVSAWMGFLSGGFGARALTIQRFARAQPGALNWPASI